MCTTVAGVNLEVAEQQITLDVCKTQFEHLHSGMADTNLSQEEEEETLYIRNGMGGRVARGEGRGTQQKHRFYWVTHSHFFQQNGRGCWYFMNSAGALLGVWEHPQHILTSLCVIDSAGIKQYSLQDQLSDISLLQRGSHNFRRPVQLARTEDGRLMPSEL